MNLYQKLIEVRKAVPYLQKEAEGQQYKYVGSSQVLASVRAKMDELGLLLTVKVLGHNVNGETVENEDKYGKKKKTTTYFTELDLEFTWINAEKPEEILSLPFYGQGVDIAGEKGVGKALTYAEKYFLLKQFTIATDKDDPDAFQQKSESYRKPDPITSEQVGQIKLKVGTLMQMRKVEKEAVYSQLKTTEAGLVKHTSEQAVGMLNALDVWIKNAQKEIQKQTAGA